MTELKKRGEMGSPCRTPWLISILLLNTPPSPLITVVLPVTISHMSARESVSSPCMQRARSIEEWLTVSNALARSTQTMFSSFPDLCASLTMVIRVVILSKAPSVPDRKTF
ncbi:hypothetical protein T12_2445 [Trichinella patagoniensis]|uniref:Uncharacterized protein n=1 Tax=Trichinella patagoniensis TaxID=990121 RepID=A0A0V0Z5D5_9BILA|nr:hypothetical protein T12_10291 [Trichinella patagoniensis]KRY07650.1 hypothetical protein T12_2445 [Trichinella patagoniensis]